MGESWFRSSHVVVAVRPEPFALGMGSPSSLLPASLPQLALDKGEEAACPAEWRECPR